MGPINIYQVYADVCIPKRVAAEANHLMAALAGRPQVVEASVGLKGTGFKSHCTHLSVKVLIIFEMISVIPFRTNIPKGICNFQ
jgi:hypothetical protein